MDFTPEDMEAVRACLEGIDVEPAAAKLLTPNTVRTVPDIFTLADSLPNSSGLGWDVERLLPRSV